MKKTLISLLILTVSFCAFSQDKKFSLEINYPLPLGENFIGKNYNGFIDVGFTYQIIDAPLVNFAFSFNSSLLSYNFDLQDEFAELYDYKVNAYFIQPKFIAQIAIPTMDKFHPSAGIGYSFIVFKVSGSDPLDFGNESASDNQNGINFNLGATYDISEKIFIKGQYDFIKLSKGNKVPNTPYNKNVHLLKIGLGIWL